MVLSIFGSLDKKEKKEKNQEKNCWKKTKKNIAIRKRHGGAQKWPKIG
jgi:hypothetical protein